MRPGKQKNERAPGMEFIINFAMVYSLLGLLFLVPYVHERRFHTQYLLWIYGIAVVAYAVIWVIDKGEVLEYERFH